MHGCNLYVTRNTLMKMDFFLPEWWSEVLFIFNLIVEIVMIFSRDDDMHLSL